MAKQPNKIQSIVPVGGMDKDSDQKFIRNGDYRSLVNGIKYGEGEDGVVKNIKGNENVETTAQSFLTDNDGNYLVDDLGNITTTELDGNIPPSKIVEYCKDPKRNGIILFLKGVSGEGSQSVSDSISTYSSIYEFFVAGEIYVPIVKNNQVIDFTEDVVYSTVIGDRLFWLERGGEPKTINIKRAYNTTHNKGGDCYDSIDEDVVSLIKKPPLYEIDFLYGYDSDYKGSNVFKRVFQFREQYIYEDGLRSAFGNTSKVAYNKDVFVFEDSSLQKADTDNYIDIKFNSGDATVNKIRIAAREGNIGDWYEIAVIDKDNPQNVFSDYSASESTSSYESELIDNTDYYYRFYNSGGYRFIADRDIEKPSENIPIKSNVLSSLGNNKLIFGMNQVDYADITNNNATLTPSYNAISSKDTKEITIDGTTRDTVEEPGGNWSITSSISYDMSNLPNLLYSGTIIKLKAYQWIEYTGETDGGGTSSGLTTEHPSSGDMGELEITLTQTVTLDYFCNNLNTLMELNTYDSFSYDDTNKVLTINYKEITAFLGGISITDYSLTDEDTTVDVQSDIIDTTIKRGRWVRGAVRYMDKYGRGGEPQTTEDMEVFVKNTTETTNKGSVDLDFTISHIPPDWAYYYQFLIAHQQHNFIQAPVLYADAHRDVNGEKDGTVVLLLGFSVDKITDILQDDLDRLQEELSNAEKNIYKWERFENNEGFFPSIGEFFEDVFNPQKDHEEASLKRQNLGMWKGRKRDLERKIELKKYELGNAYKRALVNVKQYQFSKNDRIKILKKGSNTGNYDSTSYVDEVLDIQVLDVLDSNFDSGNNEETGLWLQVKPPNKDGYDLSAAEESNGGQWRNSLIEVYKPSYSENTNIYYEASKVYSITNPTTESRVHGTKSGTLDFYNAYLKNKSFYEGDTSDAKGDQVTDWFEDTHITHDFKSDDYFIGRVFTKTDIQKSTTHTSLVYTNSHFEGTQINGLSQADYNNVKYLSEEHGDIYGIRRSGNTLKVFQGKKITSFYPKDNTPFGRMRHSQTDYGTIYPKSIVESPYGYIYGFDVYNGLVWRDTNNGVYNISGKSVVRGGMSNYYMGNYFRQVAREIRKNGISKGSDDVITAYDEENQLVYFSFLQSGLNEDVVPYRTVIFHEPSNRWVGFLDIQPTGYGYGYNSLLSSESINGNIYTHNYDDADRCNFYGDQKNFEIEFIGNIMPGIRKVFNAMHIHATTAFDVPSITVSTDSTNNNGQKSKLTSNNFNLKDGVYESNILNDMTTTDDTERTNELYTGDRMRGYSLKFKLQSSSSSEFELFKVDLFVEPSL
jgi:hypothetical protein